MRRVIESIRVLIVAGTTLLAASAAASPPGRNGGMPLLLDNFSDASVWQLVHSKHVQASLQAEHGALCLSYAFAGKHGYAGLRRTLPIRFPPHYALAFQMNGRASGNDVRVTVGSADGGGHWQFRRAESSVTPQWRQVRFTDRDASYVGGPIAAHPLHRTRTLELAVVAKAGGRGRVCFDNLSFERAPPWQRHTKPKAGG